MQNTTGDTDKAGTSTELRTDSNIMNTLLVHESKSAAPAQSAVAALGGAASDKSDDSDMEDVNTGTGEWFYLQLVCLVLR